MSIEELENKHKEIIGQSDLHIPEWLCPDISDELHGKFYKIEEKSVSKEATKLSIEFAISVLNNLEPSNGTIGIVDKIQELKEYLK